jgi:hypothetical protein
MHINHTKTLESAISTQGESTSDLKAMTTKVLTETREIRKIQEDTKYSISAINKKLDAL